MFLVEDIELDFGLFRQPDSISRFLGLCGLFCIDDGYLHIWMYFYLVLCNVFLNKLGRQSSSGSCYRKDLSVS